MKNKLLLCSILIFGLIVSACGSSPASKAPEASSAAQRYEVKGKVVSADKANHKVTIEHEEIKGYMDAMTMPFTLLEDWVYSELKPGAQIQATLVVDQGRSWLENPIVSNIVDSNLAAKAAESETAPPAGTETPDFTLVNQDGRKISFKQYRGKAIVLTFIYTRCPLPDYCPLMTQNFSAINRELQNNPSLRDKTRMLSITLDPGYDKPNVLREYGASRAGLDKDGFKQWEFATGSPEQIKTVAQFFGLKYWQEKDQIIHGLRTAIITPDGKIAKVYRGNDWRPDDVVKDLEKLGS
ncbi:MAG: SCO family protein [Chloracidobacterium sp.]|nr:SCO family protein [Chloracidobacterium sp.]